MSVFPLYLSTMFVREARYNDIPRLLAMEQQSPGAAHWGEQHYRAMFTTAVVPEQSNPASPGPFRICLVVECIPARQAEATMFPGNDATPLAAKVPPPSADGFLVAQSVAGEWEIENLVVDARCRRRGVASRLLRELLCRVEASRGETIALEVRESNEAARALYAKWGFREAGRRKGYYRQPEEAALLLLLDCRNWHDLAR
jgi:ribosomal-protein-alanine N-acetyltransferase